MITGGKTAAMWRQNDHWLPKLADLLLRGAFMNLEINMFCIKGTVLHKVCFCHTSCSLGLNNGPPTSSRSRKGKLLVYFKIVVVSM